MLGHAGAQAAPIGWHLMTGIGLLMFLIFGHLYFGPYRRLQRARGRGRLARRRPARQPDRQAGDGQFRGLAGWRMAAITFLA